MRKIAITGTIGVGKSTVCQLLQERGAYVIDADTIVHQLLKLDHPLGQQVVELLGSEILTDNQINRKKISNIVFSKPEKLKALESILHPAVRLEINRLFESVKNHPSYRLFVAEVPLLYEAGMEDEFDAVVAVIAEPSKVRQRAHSKDEIDRRSQMQFSQETKRAKADYTIANQEDLLALKSQVDQLIPQLLKEHE